jgi:hypothetical protein
LTFNEKNASAWSFINELRSSKTHIFLFDELDNTEWFLDPADAVQYKSYKKQSIRLWKRKKEETKFSQKWIKILLKSRKSAVIQIGMPINLRSV